MDLGDIQINSTVTLRRGRGRVENLRNIWTCPKLISYSGKYSLTE